MAGARSVPSPLTRTRGWMTIRGSRRGVTGPGAGRRAMCEPPLPIPRCVCVRRRLTIGAIGELIAIWALFRAASFVGATSDFSRDSRPGSWCRDRCRPSRAAWSGRSCGASAHDPSGASRRSRLRCARHMAQNAVPGLRARNRRCCGATSHAGAAHCTSRRRRANTSPDRIAMRALCCGRLAGVLS